MRPSGALKVLIAPSSFAAHESAPVARLEGAGFEPVRNPYGRMLAKNELAGLLNGVSGVIAGLERYDDGILNMPGLKVISRCGSGISNIDLGAAERLGVMVLSTPAGPVTAVAELTVGAMICLLRNLSLMDKEMHEGRWNKRIGAGLNGKKVAIVGFGRIGRKVAELLKPFGARMTAVDPYFKEAGGVKASTLDEALKEADIITLHLSGEEEIIGAREFSLMKDGAFLLNAARGPLVNEDALIKALEAGRLKGAWLDTFSEEPYTGPLDGFPQVLLTPHAGSYTGECRRAMEMEAVENLIAAFAGMRP